MPTSHNTPFRARKLVAGFPQHFRNVTQYLIYRDAYVTTTFISNRIVTKRDLNILSFSSFS
jgi:hypothetical protein